MTTKNSPLNNFSVRGVAYTQSINTISDATFVTRVHDDKEMCRVSSDGYVFDGETHIGRFRMRLGVWVFVGKNNEEYSFNSHDLIYTELCFFQKYLESSK